MNFRVDDSIDKVYNIFVHIEEKLGVALNDFTYKSRNEEYLKTIVSNEICFKHDKDNEINKDLNEKTKYTCRAVLQIQTVTLIWKIINMT